MILIRVTVATSYGSRVRVSHSRLSHDPINHLDEQFSVDLLSHALYDNKPFRQKTISELSSTFFCGNFPSFWVFVCQKCDFDFMDIETRLWGYLSYESFSPYIERNQSANDRVDRHPE